MRLLAITLVAVLFLAGASVVAWTLFNDRESTGGSKLQRAEADIKAEHELVERFFAQTPVVVTAAALRKAYETNEVAAREQFLGRPLRIDGHVGRVTVELVNEKEFPVLYFREGGACAFNWGAAQPELAKLKAGQRVVVIGQPRGNKGPGQHLTTHCSIDSWYE